MTFSPYRGENSDLHFTPCCGENSDLTTFSPCYGENSDLHHTVVKTQHLHNPVGKNSDFYNIYTTPWWKFRFTQYLHHAVMKIQIFTMP